MIKNNIKNFVYAMIAVLLIVTIVGGATFAYFQWTTSDTQKTNINVTIEAGGITMHIEPEATSFVGLKPSANYDVRYADALVTIVNNTGTMAIPSFRLKAKVTKGGSDALTSDMLSHIHYSVYPLITTKDAEGNPVKGLAMLSKYGYIYTCSVPTWIDYEAANQNKYLFNMSSTLSSSLRFDSVATDGTWTHIPNAGDLDVGDRAITGVPAYLPRQYYLEEEKLSNYTNAKGDVNGITFKAPQYETTYQYFRVCLWIDEDYTSTTIGNTVSDPLQNAKIEVTWSEQSMVQQVAA